MALSTIILTYVTWRHVRLAGKLFDFADSDRKARRAELFALATRIWGELDRLPTQPGMDPSAGALPTDEDLKNLRTLAAAVDAIAGLNAAVVEKEVRELRKRVALVLSGNAPRSFDWNSWSASVRTAWESLRLLMESSSGTRITANPPRPMGDMVGGNE